MTTMNKPIRALAGTLMLASSMLAVAATAHEQTRTEFFNPGMDYAVDQGSDASAAPPPLYEGLGSTSMPISTKSTQAQAYFDQGLRLAWAFNHAEARRSFREAQRLDGECAMCFWGEAFVLGPNINDAMREGAAIPAREAVYQAVLLKDVVTPKERLLIEALAERYATDPTAARQPLDQAWADAMAIVARAYPEDAHVQALYAEALMNLQPWDYWEAGGLTTKGVGGEILAVLEHALELDPDHIGSAHLYVHAIEASADPGRAEEVADRLRGAAPAAGHLTHMPAHIYMRVGRHADSIAVNHEAIAADEAFLEQAAEAASPLYRYGYYPHNVHFLMVSAQMAGVEEDVIGAAEKLAAITSEVVSDELAWVQAIRTAPFTAHAQFSDPATILGLADPGDRFPFVKGHWHYARGIAFALAGEVSAASNEAASIEQLIEEADMSGLEDQFLPARDVLGIALHVVRARIAQKRFDYTSAEQHLVEAVKLQDGISYMEPPYWYYPVRQTLGAVLLQQGNADEAVGAFERALAEAPRNGWALWGLLQAKSASGVETSTAKQAFENAWLGNTDLLTLDRL